MPLKIALQVLDNIITALRPCYGERDPEKHKAAMEKFLTDTLIPHVAIIESHLEKNGGFLVGKGVTEPIQHCSKSQ